MQPYYQTHPIGVLYLFAVTGWYLMEVTQFLRQRQWRKNAVRISPRSYWPAFWIAMAVAAGMLFLAPHIAPAATIGHPAVAFGVGIGMVIAGAAVRGWSFETLGRYFTFTVKLTPDQPVITAGPYRLLRHPGYAGGLLATAGIGVMWGNWLSLATLTVATLAFIVWRIHTEETALLATLDDRYRAYASSHKRLVPLIW
jgi:protein-S-isoprenylcysteine O-methyltransferase Ste14